ncbi:uncharacterized protein LOC143478089 isoform X2 [Brachyhypopomus gauderio]|uniref:uncharacterized protein LOC143478089 isoform X2 n=1 Tax=Brachyhypopomus gauderio TaxID=698409 RepID=UPI004041C187
MLGDASMLGETALDSSHHGNARVYPTGSEAEGDEKPTCGTRPQPADTFSPHADCIALDEGKGDFKRRLSVANLIQDDTFLSQDDTFFLEGCVQLERRWVLWHEFMKEHSCLDDWLRQAEKLAARPNSSHVLYITAKEELQKFEGLRAETGLRLVQLDSLGQRSRALLGLFTGTMRRRLVEMTKECGQRWDQLSAMVDSVCRRLKHFVLQREDFERQREEVAVWLADMDLRLTEVEHFSERDTCAKMRQLQGFQQAVAESAGRLNALLQRGEELIQRSEPADAQVIEGQLQELLIYCGRVFQGLGRLHTRLLSMRLVFEDDWSLCPDSGCPSESVLEEEGVVESGPAPPAVPSTPPLPCHEHLGLEWDPMVDIGGSVSHDDADSSYFSAGVCGTLELLAKDPLGKRVSLGPMAPTAARILQPHTERSLEGMAPPQTSLPDAEGPQYAGLWKTSTPGSHSLEPVTFDPDRISAWLGQSHRLCSKAVQTECAPQRCSSLPPSTLEETEADESKCLGNVVLTRRRCSPRAENMGTALSCDLQPHTAKWHASPQCQKMPCSSGLVDGSSQTKTQCVPSGQGHSVGRFLPVRLLRLVEALGAPARLYVLLLLLLVLVILAAILLQDGQCHRSNTLARSFHLALRYVNGPPPT